MFQNISFTFLCALAFISWSVLCYLDANDDQADSSTDYNVELYTELPIAVDVPKYCPHNSSQNNFSDRIYEILMSYGIVLLTTVLLSRLLQWLELQACSNRQADETPPLKINKYVQNLAIEREGEAVEQRVAKKRRPIIVEQENVELKEQLNDLQTRCRELIRELHAVNSNSMSTELPCNTSNSSFTGSDSDSCPNDDEPNSIGFPLALSNEEQSLPLAVRNVYVTHSHFHFNFNGSVQLQAQNFNVNVLNQKQLRRRSEFAQVWGTFIKGPTEWPMLPGINNILI
ncbi:uncharacterized protein LOC6556553 [Drosophila grimshawi]|uniref:GH16823 n=1 Tax=Drosophila grimshawi TaxID=7222 RepID=B4IWW6_DROGR|nr:uncharacterized protein LOC6556553 [Drosophila grimshawi]EDV97367.1 GH16823 [Drosophila grimshawi]